jgi:hypothetical protein
MTDLGKGKSSNDWFQSSSAMYEARTLDCAHRISLGYGLFQQEPR